MVLWQGDSRKAQLENEMASRLLRAATSFWTYHTNKLSTAFEPDENSQQVDFTTKTGVHVRFLTGGSKPGEYPRKRTGALISGVVFGPSSIVGIMASGLKVRIGILKNVWYGLYLELYRQRLGFKASADALKPFIQTTLGQKAVS